MPQLTAADMAVWEITYRDPGRPSLQVKAAYPTSSDKSMPGQLVLKDWRSKAVFAVPVDQQLSVVRVDHVCTCA